ncbi:MAG TPA: SDR family oxidoreductase [Longimicrobiales bacterium]|nr:SDR family oxidoreductase [Longimicrobiales bacterium]
MSVSLKPLDQQVMVITGASSGIGLATAISAARQGAALVLNARSEDVIKDVAGNINNAGGQAIHVVGDVGKREEVDRIAQAAIDRFGRIDTWINNAGVSMYGPITSGSDEDNRRLFDTNFWGSVYGSFAALPHLKRQGGALINLGSEVSDAVVPLQGIYSASKHAVKGFTDALRMELQHEDAPVAVTLIQPGATNTPFPQHARNNMAQEPALPEPMDDPYHVAEKILDAATTEKRAIIVSRSAKMNVLLSKFAPKVADRVGQQYFEKQKYDEPPRDPSGTLYKPGHSGRAYGSGGQRAKV